MPDFDDRRRSQRVELTDTTAIVLTVAGKPIRAQLTDISKEGVCVIPEESISQGVEVIIDHPTAGKLEGCCVWTHEDSIGIQFGLEESELERVFKCLHLMLDGETLSDIS